MGRLSTNPNKTIYQERREELGLSRDKASEMMPGISPERIEKIENGKSEIRPYEIREMAEAYRDPGLCNYYCANDCELGAGKVPIVEGKELSQIAVQTYNLLNRLDKEKDRLMEIVEDEKVTADEYDDFIRIKETLIKMSHTIDSLDLWLQEKMASGEMKVR